jgi:hypothetical protein
MRKRYDELGANWVSVSLSRRRGFFSKGIRIFAKGPAAREFEFGRSGWFHDFFENLFGGGIEGADEALRSKWED